MKDDVTKYVNCKYEVVFIPARHCVMSYDLIDEMQDKIDTFEDDARRSGNRVKILASLLQRFYELNANGVFSLHDSEYALIAETAVALDVFTKQDEA